MTYRVLSDHFGRVKSTLLQHAGHFDIANHGDIKGYGREALVQEFLATHLPDQVEYLSGEILDANDHRSGQIDIIVQSKKHPKIPLLGSLHLAFIDSVVAAIEVKSNLTTQHLNASLEQCKKLKALQRNVVLENGGLAKKLTTVPCVVFAFKGPKKDTLLKSINEFAQRNFIALDAFCPDMIVVLEEDYYVCKNDGWQFPFVPAPGAYFRDWQGLPHENLVGLYNYLNNVIQAFTDKSPRLEIGNYFTKSQFSSK